MGNIERMLESLPQHWPFLVASVLIGYVGQFMKKRVWTKERARAGGVFWWARATMTLHAPLAGVVFGIATVAIFGADAPAGPGVSGTGHIILYYLGAGTASSLTVAAVKKFAESKGLIADDDFDMPGDSIPVDDDSDLPPASELPTKPNNLRPL